MDFDAVLDPVGNLLRSRWHVSSWALTIRSGRT